MHVQTYISSVFTCTSKRTVIPTMVHVFGLLRCSIVSTAYMHHNKLRALQFQKTSIRANTQCSEGFSRLGDLVFASLMSGIHHLGHPEGGGRTIRRQR